MLRKRVERVALHADETGKRCRDDDRAARLHHGGEAPHAEDDAVEVRAADAPVGLVGDGGHVRDAGRHAGVQERELDRADRLPRSGVADVEAGAYVEHRHLVPVALEEVDDRAADAGRAAGHERAQRGPMRSAPSSRMTSPLR